MSKKKFTWADLKKFVNSLPEKELRKPVRIWREDEGLIIGSAWQLEENYHDTGEGCCGRSELNEQDWKELKADGYGKLVHKKGTPIMQEDF
jgi:hypothetical protein